METKSNYCITDTILSKDDIIRYLNDKLGLSDQNGWRSFDKSKELCQQSVDVLKVLGVNTIEDLEAILPKHFTSSHKGYVFCYDELIRDILLISDADKYFTNCYDGHTIYSTKIADLQYYKIDFTELVKKHKINIKCMKAERTH